MYEERKERIVQQSDTRYLKNKKAITLIALVITIIILIILAGVAINITLGKNGLLNRTKQAKVEYNEKEAIEKLEIAFADLCALKETDESYNENKYIDDYLIDKGFSVSGDIVIVGQYGFEIDREKLKIRSNIGQVQREKIYTIIYDYNNGKKETTSNMQYDNNKFTITDKKPSQSGYTFENWNTTKDGTGITYVEGNEVTLENNLLTLYAQWEEADEVVSECNITITAIVKSVTDDLISTVDLTTTYNKQICTLKVYDNDTLLNEYHPYSTSLTKTETFAMNKDYTVEVITVDKILAEFKVRIDKEDIEETSLGMNGTVDLGNECYQLKWGANSSYVYGWRTGSVKIGNDAVGKGDPCWGEYKTLYKIAKATPSISIIESKKVSVKKAMKANVIFLSKYENEEKYNVNIDIFSPEELKKVKVIDSENNIQEFNVTGLKNTINLDLSKKDYNIKFELANNIIVTKTIRFQEITLDTPLFIGEGYNQSATLPDGMCYVRYGIGTRFYYKWLAGTIIIGNETFGGDPASGEVKSAHVMEKVIATIQ